MEASSMTAFISALPTSASSFTPTRQVLLTPRLATRTIRHTPLFPARRRPPAPEAAPVPLSRRASPRASALSAGVGTSALPDTSAAVAAALDAAAASLPPGVAPTACILTSTVDRAPADVLRAARARLPTSVALHGATTCAAVLTNGGPVPNGVSALLLHVPQTQSAAALAAAAASISELDDAEAVAAGVATRLKERMGGADVGNVLVAATPGEEEAVLRGVARALPRARVFGGSAADNAVAGAWAVFGGDEAEPLARGVSLLGVGDGVRFGAALVAPYEATGTGARVTAASGRTVNSLEGRAAGEVLGSWVGDEIADQVRSGGDVIVPCARFPLGVARAGEDGFVGVHAAQIGEDGSIGLFAEVSEGERLTVMANAGGGDSVSAAAVGVRRAYDAAMADGGLSEPKAGVLIYCGGLSIAVGDGLARSLDDLAGKAPLIGMTAFGEQGAINGTNVHSNLAVGVALFE